MNTLERLVETLGGVVSVACAPHGLDIEVHDVVVHDFVDPVDVTAGDLVLGVSVGAGPAAEVVTDLASSGIAAVVLKTTALADESVVEAAERAGLAVLSIPAGASWSQIMQLIQAVLSHGAVSRDDVAGLAAADLFALADAIAALIDAPVTIEDRLSRVLAYSSRQDEADPARAETIVGRRVPDRLVRKLEEAGIFKQLQQRDDCVYVESIGKDILPRLAVAVRAGSEVLGSIWAAVPQRPSADVERQFRDTAKVAALHLLRHRAGADVEKNLQADLLASILEGTSSARDAAIRLGLMGPAFRVIAGWLATRDAAEERRARTDLRDVFAVHISTYRVRGAVALLGGIVYGVVEIGNDPVVSEGLAQQIADDFIARSGHDERALFGIGGHAAALDEVPRSKREAEEALRVLRGGTDRLVATIDDVRLSALLSRFSETVAADHDLYEQKLAPLIDADRTRNTAYLDALGAYFEAFGDYTAAATRLHIHPNTLRYRLRKAEELSGMRLDDPDERLAVMLLLRLLAPGQ